MNNSQFSLANRKHLADMLDDRYHGLRYKAKQRYREMADALQKSFVDEIAEKKGATKVVAQIEAAEQKIKELKANLAALGFQYDDGDLCLNYGSDNTLNKTIEERVEKELGTIDDIDARFDSAQIAMMTVASLEDADKLLKSVSAI